MTKNNETTDKPTETSPVEAKTTEAPEGAAAPRTRKIVRRSASTAERPNFNAGDEAKPAEGAPAGGEAAPAAAPGAAPAAPAPRERAIFDTRAPRPAPGASRPPRPQGDRPARPQRSGDYRPPPARPVGARPIPGGPRAPAADRPRDDRPRPDRPRDDRPRDDRRPPRAEGEARAPRPEGAPAPRPAAPPPRPAPVPQPAHPAKPQPAKVAAPKAKPIPILLNVPPPRAGSAAAKPALTAKEMLSARAKAATPAKVEAPKAKAAEGPATFDAALLSVGQDGAKEALRSVGDKAASLVDAWVTANNAAAIVAVAEAADVASVARKAARRGLNVLRSRGVAIPAQAHVVRLDDRVEVSLEATYLPPDPSGTSSVTIASRDASGRYHIAEVIIREPLGIIQAGAGWLSGSQLKEGRARASEGLGVSPVAVPVDWARHVIASARQLNSSSKYVLPLNLEGCKDLIEPAPEAAPAHPVADLEAEITLDLANASLAASGELHQEAEFRAWLPDRGALDEMLRKVGERLGADSMGDAEKVNAALKEEMDAAADRFFSPEVREIIVGRMRGAAISLRARKGDRRASEALAVARAVKEAGLITSPPREIPFLVGFFQKALGILAQQGGGQLRVPVAAPGA